MTSHLPVGCRKILMSYNTEKIMRPRELVDPDEEKPLVVVIGGIAVGKVGGLDSSWGLYARNTGDWLL